MNYIIVNTSDLDSIDFADMAVLKDYVRKSLDGTKALLKYSGSQPFSVLGTTEYSLEEIKPIMRSAEWFDADDTI